MSDSSPLKIVVDCDASFPAADTPQRLIDALKRQLRKSSAAASALQNLGSERTLFGLIVNQDGRYRVPQALLSRVTQACSKHGIEYTVLDQRTQAASDNLRTNVPLNTQQHAALHRLLLSSAGVLICPSARDRQAVLAELIARRRQRTLLFANDPADASKWRDALVERLALAAHQVCGLANVDDNTQLAIACYAETPSDLSAARFGLIICDEIDSAPAAQLMRTIRRLHARYIVGAANRSTRDDELHGPIYLALGGPVHQMGASRDDGPPIKLVYRSRITAFDHPYNGRSDYQKLISALTTDVQRNALIAADITDEARAGHRCLVLSDRRDHFDGISAELSSDIRSDQLTSAVRPADRRAIAARIDSGEINVLFATTQIAAESVRSPTVDRLFISYPFSYSKTLETLVSLVMKPHEDKSEAMVIDYHDVAIGPLHRAFDKRARLLERLRRDAEDLYNGWAQLDLFG
ncbi:MAG: hypothetical protein H6707_13990 [Deltaproteobacteria bacterium]|nr:hypothetical protein [Deltaproteobacteria bacterium]